MTRRAKNPDDIDDDLCLRVSRQEKAIAEMKREISQHNLQRTADKKTIASLSEANTSLKNELGLTRQFVDSFKQSDFPTKNFNNALDVLRVARGAAEMSHQRINQAFVALERLIFEAPQ